ncbi:unnamed protein product, partial [Brassica napus]
KTKHILGSYKHPKHIFYQTKLHNYISSKYKSRIIFHLTQPILCFYHSQRNRTRDQTRTQTLVLNRRP